ncbi:MAG: phage tail protein I [Aeromonas veronii]
MNDLPEWARAPLLPYASSQLEQDLDVALSHIETTDIPIETLWDPALCPLVALPYLAWALNVDNWENAWEERVKRQVVAAALDVHRIKGTRPAVEKALLALDVRCVIREWFETGAQSTEPGTFSVIAQVSMGDDQQIDPNLTRIIREAVDAVRPASRPFTLRVDGVMRVILGAAAVLRATRLITLNFETQ